MPRWPKKEESMTDTGTTIPIPIAPLDVQTTVNMGKTHSYPQVQDMIGKAVPVSYVKFHEAVDTPSNSPEYYLSNTATNKARQASLWLTPHMIICLQKGKYFGVPCANIKFVNF